LIGQKEQKITELISLFEKNNAFLYTTVVAVPADAIFAEIYLAPFVGSAIAEYFRDKGQDSLVIYDDLSKHAKAYRDISLLLERAPGREAYPADMFSLHAQLLERPAQLSDQYGGGSMSALPIIETQEKISVMDLLFKGGFMIIPILLLFIITIYIFIERILVINKESKSPKNFTNEIIKRVNNNDINGAKLICNDTNNPIARMILKGLNKIENSLKNIETSIENVGKIEIYNLEKNLSLLATISGAAPMLGFLGTVIGMIRAFISIAQEEGAVSPKLLSSGIYEAMISTAAGLFVGIIAYLAYNYLVSRVEKLIYRMEYSTIEFIETLQSKR